MFSKSVCSVSNPSTSYICATCFRNGLRQQLQLKGRCSSSGVAPTLNPVQDQNDEADHDPAGPSSSTPLAQRWRFIMEHFGITEKQAKRVELFFGEGIVHEPGNRWRPEVRNDTLGNVLKCVEGLKGDNKPHVAKHIQNHRVNADSSPSVVSVDSMYTKTDDYAHRLLEQSATASQKWQAASSRKKHYLPMFSMNRVPSVGPGQPELQTRYMESETNGYEKQARWVLLNDAITPPPRPETSGTDQPDAAEQVTESGRSGVPEVGDTKVIQQKAHARRANSVRRRNVPKTSTPFKGSSDHESVHNTERSVHGQDNNEQSQPEKPGHKWPPTREPRFADRTKPGVFDSIEVNKLHLTPLDTPETPVPTLAHDLQRVLFNPGIYQLQDPRSRVYNFDPYLQNIMPLADFNVKALKDYIVSSKDEILREMANKQKAKYYGSTSSMTSVLAQFHFLISHWRPLNLKTLSQSFTENFYSFTAMTRAPSAVFLRYKDGAYAIDADREYNAAHILMELGKSLEKFLTLPPEEYMRYKKDDPVGISEEERNTPEAYSYTSMGDFLMRSQLDAHDPRLPGTGTFDLKTRAVVSIRMSPLQYEAGLGYEINQRFGDWQSYEKEYYDMIRSMMLKYSLQVRMGNMDGIFVAYHNVERIFGFQYISRSEMDSALHGQSDTTLGDQEFKASLKLWQDILNKSTERFPEQSLRFHFEAREGSPRPFMYIFAEPVTDQEIEAIQSTNQAEIEAATRKLYNDQVDAVEGQQPFQDEPEAGISDKKPLESKSNTELDQGDDALTENNSSHNASETASSQKEILGLILTIRNVVNSDPIVRPTNLTSNDTWTIDYKISEIKPDYLWPLYKATRRRREEALEWKFDESDEKSRDATEVDNSDIFVDPYPQHHQHQDLESEEEPLPGIWRENAYFKQIHTYVREGKKRREREERDAKEREERGEKIQLLYPQRSNGNHGQL